MSLHLQEKIRTLLSICNLLVLVKLL